MKSSLRSGRIPRLHLWLGLSAGLYFLFLGLTGIALNHRTDWGLEEKTVSHRFLPSHYRPMGEGERTRLDIVLADLHSGLLFGRYGPTVSDLIALILMASTLTGFALGWRRSRKRGASFQTPRAKPVADLPPIPAEASEPQQLRITTSNGT